MVVTSFKVQDKKKMSIGLIRVFQKLTFLVKLALEASQRDEKKIHDAFIKKDQL